MVIVSVKLCLLIVPILISQTASLVYQKVNEALLSLNWSCPRDEA